MSVALHGTYKQRTFEPGVLAKAFRATMDKAGIPFDEKFKFEARYRLGEAGSENRELTIAQIGAITQLQHEPREVVFGYTNPDKSIDIIEISGFADELRVAVQSGTAERAAVLKNSFESLLGLHPKETLVRKDLAKEIGAIGKRLDHLETVLAAPRRLRCFISYRFAESSKVYIQELSRFLELHDIDVVTGATYEPRRVSDKVLDRLSGANDILVYLITNTGESAWTRDEVALSKGKGAYVIPLLERGAKMERGLLSDLEYIRFEKGHISDTFIGILEAVRFVLSKKRSVPPSKKPKKRVSRP